MFWVIFFCYDIFDRIPAPQTGMTYDSFVDCCHVNMLLLNVIWDSCTITARKGNIGQTRIITVDHLGTTDCAYRVLADIWKQGVQIEVS